MVFRAEEENWQYNLPIILPGCLLVSQPNSRGAFKKPQAYHHPRPLVWAKILGASPYELISKSFKTSTSLTESRN